MLMLPGCLRSALGHSECRHLTQLIRPPPGGATNRVRCFFSLCDGATLVEVGDSMASSNCCFFFQPPLRHRDGKIITLWLLTFPCMISCWYNSITLSNKPFQKQLEPDFNWAARQLLFALIWLSHCWIAFDDHVRRSRWDNHSLYPALIPVLSNTRDIAVQVREAVTPNQANGPSIHREVEKGWEPTGFVFSPSMAVSKHFICYDVDGSIPSMFLASQKLGRLALCLSFTYAVAGGVLPGGRRRIGGRLLSPGSDPRCQGCWGQR